MTTYTTVNGCGMTHYGKCDFRPDGSYVSTLWFTIIYVPLIPVSSALLRDIPKSEGGGFYRTKTAFHYWQALRTWLFAAPLVLWVLVASDFIPSEDVPFLNDIPAPLADILAWYPLFMLPLPWLLRRHAKRKIFRQSPQA